MTEAFQAAAFHSQELKVYFCHLESFHDVRSNVSLYPREFRGIILTLNIIINYCQSKKSEILVVILLPLAWLLKSLVLVH